MTIEQMKKQGMDNLLLVTHWKSHHADDVMAGAMLAYFLVKKLELFNNVMVERVDYNEHTGKELKAKYESNDTYCMVYDVGRGYDPKHGMFDHHQFTKEEDGRASAGMVFDWLISEGVIDEALKRSMATIVKMVDDNDIGVIPAKEGELSWIIRHMNVDYDSSNEEHDEAYLDSMYFMAKMIESLDKANEELKVTMKKFQEADKVLEDGKYYGLEFNSFPKNWQSYVYGNKHPDPDKELDLIVWNNENDDTWQAQTVNVSATDYAKVGRSIKVDDAYINDPDNDITFVHKGEFFMVAKTKDALYKYLDKFLYGKEDINTTGF